MCLLKFKPEEVELPPLARSWMQRLWQSITDLLPNLDDASNGRRQCTIVNVLSPGTTYEAMPSTSLPMSLQLELLIGGICVGMLGLFVAKKVYAVAKKVFAYAKRGGWNTDDDGSDTTPPPPQEAINGEERDSMGEGAVRASAAGDANNETSHITYDRDRAQVILEYTLNEMMNGVTYSSETSNGLATKIAEKIRMRIGGMKFDRYKIIVMTNIGPLNGQGIHMGFQGLLDTEKDTYNLAEASGINVVCCAVIYAIYCN